MPERPMSKAGWTRVALATWCAMVNDRVDDPDEAGLERYVGLEHIDPGRPAIRRWGDIGDGIDASRMRFKPGHVLFGKRRAYQRKVAVADFEGICSGDIYVLRAKDPSVLLPELLPFIMQTDAFIEHAVEISVGSLSPTINWTSLAEYEFALPPLEEQRRIADGRWRHEQLRRRYCELDRSDCRIARLASRGHALRARIESCQRRSEQVTSCQLRDVDCSDQTGKSPIVECWPRAERGHVRDRHRSRCRRMARSTDSRLGSRLTLADDAICDRATSRDARSRRWPVSMGCDRDSGELLSDRTDATASRSELDRRVSCLHCCFESSTTATGSAPSLRHRQHAEASTSSIVRDVGFRCRSMSEADVEICQSS